MLLERPKHLKRKVTLQPPEMHKTQVKPHNRICTRQRSCSIRTPQCVHSKPRRPIFLCYCSHAQCAFPPPQHLTCRVFGTGSGWRTGATARLCYQAPASTAACSGAQLPQNLLTDTPGAPAQPTLGRKEYVLLVLEHQHKPRRGKTTR